MGLENNIPEGWLESTLGEICENISRRFNFKEKEDVIFVNTGDVSNGKFLHHNRVSKEGLPGQAKKAVGYGDILYSEIRPANKRFALVDFDSKDYVVSTKFMVLKKNDRVDLDFLYLFLTSNKAIATFQAHAEARSGTFPQITFDTISYDEILIPPIPEQKAIAKVLTAFDDKIELLQAQNKTLETMAQTIFKEWFGKYQIEDELPEGWRVGKFGEVIEFINGYAFKSKDLSKEPIENAYKVFKMGDINKGGGFKPGKTKGYFPKSMSTKLDKYILKNGDLLMSMTDMKDAVSLLGHTALMIYEDEYIVNQRVGLIRAQNDLNIEYPYLYLLTNNDDFIAAIRAGANSGVQVNLSTQGIKETEFVIADKETNKTFNNVVMPLFEKRKANSQMIRKLKKTRDTLLPKLMSGQVRVNNIKQTADA